VKERDEWEDVIRSKLKDFEAEIAPDDWKAIADRLPGKKVMFSRRWYYVAAGITLLLMMSVGYYLLKVSSSSPKAGEFVVEILEDPSYSTEGEEVPSSSQREEAPSYSAEGEGFVRDELFVSALVAQQTSPLSIAKEISIEELALLPVSESTQLEVKSNNSKNEAFQSFQTWFKRPSRLEHTDYIELLADATPVKTVHKPVKRWGIGAGGGSYSIGTGGGGFISDVRVRSGIDMYDNEASVEAPVKRDDNFNELLSNPNAEYYSTSIQKVGISHKQPISFGIGVGYEITNRWSLQSGVVYSLLSSEWSTVLDYQGKFKQQLHFVGVPLGITYKIAEWNKIRLYATTGGMAEWNVAGTIKSDYYFIEEETYRPIKESVRMKETQWSVNARAGATYPVIKFVNVYVEGGANYYFDNKSSIETIRSSKPFQLSLQAGLRFGF